MLFHSGLSKFFWPEAADTACYLINRCPAVVLQNKTPMQIWTDHEFDYNSLKVFGSLAYCHVGQDKLEPRAVKCVFIGYPDGVKGYKLWCIENGNKRVIDNRDVKFVENVFPLKHVVSKLQIPELTINTHSSFNTDSITEVEPEVTTTPSRSENIIAGYTDENNQVSDNEESSGQRGADLSRYQLARDNKKTRY